MYYVALGSLIVAGIGVLVAIISIIVVSHTSNREYEYNLEPKVEVTTSIAVQAKDIDGEQITNKGIDNVGFEILEKNNLDKAYLINSDYSVTEMEISEGEGNPSGKIPFGNPDLTVNNINYYYKFVLLEGFDNSYTLTLVYSKNTINDVVLAADELTDIEVLELEKGHEGDPEYEGERILADKYNEMLKYCEKYLK